jgi:hypothetical protein
LTAKGRPSGAAVEEEEEDDVGAGGSASLPLAATSPKCSLAELALLEASAHKHTTRTK